jgi:mono/diheme cytochrome c family protein
MKLGEFAVGGWARRGAVLAGIGAALGAPGALGGCGSDPVDPPAEPEIGASAARPTPPISGGTLLVTADGKTAVAADPERDRVSLVDLASKSLVATIPLEPQDEPGRVVEGPPGRAHVALRRGGAVVSIDIATGQILRRTPVCPAPRGMAYDAAGLLHVACAGGELVTLTESSGAEARRLHLEPDLRDVVISGDGLLVSLFRAAQVLEIDADGAVLTKLALHGPPTAFDGEFTFGGEFEGRVAWRMVPLPTGGAAVVHQRHLIDFVSTTPGGYGESGGCGDGIVRSTVTFLEPASGSEPTRNASIAQSALPVDLALSADGSKFAIVAAGSDTVFGATLSAYRAGAGTAADGCGHQMSTPLAEGQPIAVAFAGALRVIQTREPPQLVLGDEAIIELPGESTLDTGHELFHRSSTPEIGMACASCHPEGRDDGHVWEFPVGSRRTQSLAGGVLATAPLHWDGDLEGFDSLMGEVFTGRMGGPSQSPRRVRAIAFWVDSIPFLPASPAPDGSAVERGKAIFNDPSVGCATCHSGPRLTNNASVDVGTGGVFQVPSLRGVSARAPFMHDGCAPTLRDRFSVDCGGDDRHGVTSGLTAEDIDDLVSYLETL